jgi:hypothetical protein
VNKLLVFMVSATLLLWGAFLWKMSDKVDGGKTVEEVEVKGNPDEALDMRGLLARLKPQEMPSNGLRDPFGLPKQYVVVPKVPRRVQKPSGEPQDKAIPVKHPAIALDAVLPGDNPVAILKFRGESAVVSVGQEVWGVVVAAIKGEKVLLRDEAGDFWLN